jgi:beta-lactamase class A
MFSLRRKKKDEEEEIEDPKSSKTSEKPKRIRRKKEEPPKPWGKGERILVFGVLFATIVIAIVLALNAREWKLPGLPRIGLPKGVLEETYIFEGKPASKNTNLAISELTRITKDASGVYGVYVINLNTDETYGINEDEIFKAASLIKLPVMAGIYSEHESDNIDLDDIYKLREADIRGGSGSIAYQEIGTEYTYRELVEYMGQQSDNTAFAASVNLLGEDFVKEYIDEIGMTHTSYEENETTPRDIGLYFRKLWQGKLIEKKHRDEILKTLTDTIYEEYIPAGIPDARVAHKFGSEIHVRNDAGIVFGTDPYVLVIMSKGIVESEALEIIPQIAERVHLFETSEQGI